jgi:LEA14-like dessication related protein
MTVNTTVIIFNPNPIGATLNKVAFDVYYLDDTGHYLGHGEQTGIVIKENGNTTVTIPVKIGNIPALQAVGSLVRKGSITLKVNGSAFIDVKVTSFEKRFERSREFQASDFEDILPVTSLGGTSINVTEKVAQARGLLDALSG